MQESDYSRPGRRPESARQPWKAGPPESHSASEHPPAPVPRGPRVLNTHTHGSRTHPLPPPELLGRQSPRPRSRWLGQQVGRVWEEGPSCLRMEGGGLEGSQQQAARWPSAPPALPASGPKKEGSLLHTPQAPPAGEPSLPPSPLGVRRKPCQGILTRLPTQLTGHSARVRDNCRRPHVASASMEAQKPGVASLAPLPRQGVGGSHGT